MSIATFPSAEAHTPQNILARVTDRVERIKSIAIVYELDDGTCSIDWSYQNTSQLVFKAAVLHDEAMHSARLPVQRS